MRQPKVAGLDIGFSTKRPTTGVGLWSGNQPDLRHYFGFNACKLIADSGPHDIIAIDGPVTPKSMPPEKIRNVERVFSKGAFQRRCKPGFSHVPGTGVALRQAAGQAADMLSAAAANGFVEAFPRVRSGAIIEAFPNAFLGVCLDEESYANMPVLGRGKKFGWLYDQWKKKRLVKGLPGLTSAERQMFRDRLDRTTHHEQQAALVCILTGLLTARDQFTAVGDIEGGWFFLPPWSAWKKWAQEAITLNMSRLNDRGAQIELIRHVG